MEHVKKIITDTVFVVQILIAFILVFESSIHVPPVLQAIGRLHPLMLHLPIGLLLVTTLLIFARRFFEDTSLDELISFLLHFTALTASFTTIMGLLLSLEGTFAPDQLWLHKWLGVVLSFLCWSLLLIKNKTSMLKALSSMGVIVLIFTGHFGANLTHGEDFVFAPLQSDDLRVIRIITDSTPVFSATIEPIFESKCYGCHNSKKAKGNLVLTSLDYMIKGGKNGDLWEVNDAAHSLLVERLSLPLQDENHMPPKDRVQLSEDEIYFISHWIDAGADTDIKLNELAQDDTLKTLASVIIPRYQRQDDTPLFAFNFASPEKIEKLSRPNRTVFQIARNQPAIQAEFYLRQNFERKQLEELADVKDQLILLNLAKMPVEDPDLKIIAKFHNLEVLNLNNTHIKGNGLKELASLTRLRSLSLSGTEVSLTTVRDLGSCKSLREVLVWNTAVTEKEITLLTKEFPHIRWVIGYIPDENEILKLNAPLLKNKSQVLIYQGSKAYLELINSKDVDAVIISSPAYTHPGFMVAAGKHVYCEKPVALDVEGCNQVERIGERLGGKLSVVIGFQIRYATAYVEMVRRIQQGDIGDVVNGQLYYFSSGIDIKRFKNVSTDEARIRNHFHFRALSGGILLDQGIHMLDVCNWSLQGHPASAVSTGGKKAGPDFGDTWNNYQVLYQYPNNVNVSFHSTQFGPHFGDVCARFIGTKGIAEAHYSGGVFINGENPWDSGILRGKPADLTRQQQAAGLFSSSLHDANANKVKSFVKSIETGNCLNEINSGVGSTLTAILGREAATAKRPISWNDIRSSNDKLSPKLNLSQFDNK